MEKGGGGSKIRPWLCKEYRVYVIHAAGLRKGVGLAVGIISFRDFRPIFLPPPNSQGD